MKQDIELLNKLKEHAIIAYHKWQQCLTNDKELLARDYLKVKARIAELKHKLQIKA